MKLKHAARTALPLGVVAFVSSVLSANPAASAEPSDAAPADDGIDTARVTVTQRTFDRSWRFLDDREWSAEYSIGTVEDGTPVVDDRIVSGGLADGSGGEGAAGSGCRTIDVSLWKGRVYPGDNRVTYYVYHQNKRWCWNSGAGIVDQVHWYDYFTNVDPIWYDRGQIKNESYHYAAWGGYSKSGHKSFTQRQIENCFIYCIGVDHPWADVHAFADGAYWFNLGI
jgi:hypothetical protein